MPPTLPTIAEPAAPRVVRSRGLGQADALVLDAAIHSSLAIVRNLAAHGVRVAVGAESRLACAAASRHCREFVHHPRIDVAPEAAARALADYARRSPNVMVMPNTERTHRFLYRWRQLIEEAGACIALPPEESFHSVNDKGETLRRALRLGVPIPESYFPESFDDLMTIAGKVRYPVVVKARTSVDATDRHLRPTARVAYARSASDLRLLCSRLKPDAPMPVVQEFVHGEGVGVFLLCDRGVPLLRFAHRRVRDVVPTGSASALRESVEYPTDLGAEAERLAADVAWTGPMMVEFRVDRESGRHYLMEINGRFWGSLQLAIDAGQEFPYAYYQMTRGRPVLAASEYAVGIRSYWLMGDIQHLFRVMRGRPAGFPGEYPSRRRALLELLTPSRVPTRHEVLRWSDPKPFLYECASYLLRTVQRH